MDLILFFIIISSGSVLCSIMFNKKYEEVLPITCSAIVLVLFTFGLCNCLAIGVVAVCVLSSACYIAALVWGVKQKKIKSSMKNIFSMGFFVFIIFYTIYLQSTYKMLLHNWDEFSHWGDVVKAMVYIDDFATNPNSGSVFKSYPPGMSLLQYMMQKLYIWCGGIKISEWRLYFAYHIFAFAHMIPFFKSTLKRNVCISVISLVVVFLAPLLFFGKYYSSIYIDPFLSVLSGTGLATILWTNEKEWSYSLRIFSICSMLVLAKDAGILFAVIVGCTYLIDILMDRKKNSGKIIFYNAGGVIVSILLPKILWAIEIYVSNVDRAFSAPVNWNQLINVILGKDRTYRIDVWISFWNQLFVQGINIGDTGIKLNYLCVMCLFIFLLYLLIKEGKKMYWLEHRSGVLIVSMVIIQTCIYTVGIVISYMFKFSEYEAVSLASYSRYMNINYLAIWILIILSAVYLLHNISEEKKLQYGLIIGFFVVMMSPLYTAYGHLNRGAVTVSWRPRAECASILNKVENNVHSTDRIYVIAQGSTGLEKLIFKYELRPCAVNSGGWSIGEEQFEGDIWTQNISADEWIALLCEDYDYVVLCKVNDYFIEQYGHLFTGTEIIGNGLYRVNKETEMLEFVE